MTLEATPQADAPAASSATRPLTGAEYLESLRDGREIWLYGERVKDVTTHPAFRNTARMVARLYDALHDPATKPILTTETDTGPGGYTHRFFKVPNSADDQLAARDAIASWARQTYGFLGRAPDYKAAFLGTLGANADFYKPYDANARAWYKKAQEQVLFLNHAIIHPPVDRDRPIHERAEVCVHVVAEKDNGIVVSGAKVVATGICADPRDICGPQRADPRSGQAVRLHLHGADDLARCEADLAGLVREHRRRDGHAVRLSAVEPHRRERRHLRAG